MAPALANASAALASDGRGDCVYTSNESERAPTARTSAAAVPSPAKPAASQASSGGGGDDDVLKGLRAPRWHSFLPGMFR